MNNKVQIRKIISTDLLPVVYNYLLSLGLNSVAKKLLKKSGLDLENSESPFAEKKLQKIAKFYVTNHKQMIQKFVVHEESEEEEEEEEEAPKLTKKQRKQAKLLNKNSKKCDIDNKQSDEEEQDSGTETPIVKRRKKNSEEILPIPVIQEEEELLPGQRKYFQKCDDRRLQFIKQQLADNTHEAKRKFGHGDGFGDEGNEKLKQIQGKDFRKQKDKLKNRGFCGGSSGINTQQVNSIPL